MSKLVLYLIAFGSIFKNTTRVFSNLLSRRKNKFVEPPHNNWYGICENCGKKDGLHRLDGKRYCARCHAKLKTEKHFKAQGGEHNGN